VCFQAQRCVLNALSPQAIAVFDAVGKPSSIAARRTTVRPSTCAACAACAAFILIPSVVSLVRVCLMCRRWSAQDAVRLIDQSNLGGRAGKHTSRRPRTAFASGELCRLFHNTFVAADGPRVRLRAHHAHMTATPSRPRASRTLARISAVPEPHFGR
jgi:hypothetical protein